MSLLALLKPMGPNGFGYSSTAEDVSRNIDLTGKTLLVTGCNSGLGLETIRVLALRGAHVVGLARTVAKAQEAQQKIKAPANKFTALACELSDPKSIRACIAAIKAAPIRLDVIICNAGIMASPKLETDFGYERQFLTNHMGHFILVTGLLDQLTNDGRVIMLSSAAHNLAPKGGIDFDNLKAEKNYQPWPAYGQAKIANLIFAQELARRFAGTHRSAWAVHPGVIATNLARKLNPVMTGLFKLFSPILLKSAAQGAATQVYLAVTKKIEAPSGAYFADCNPAPCRKDALDPALGKKLWDVSEKIAAQI